MIYIIAVVSFLLDGIISNVINTNSILLPMFSLVSLILIYSYLREHIIKYLFICSIIGFLYDLLYTNTLFLNTILFLLIGLILIYIYDYFNNNIFMYLLLVIIVIIVYNTLSLLLFNLFSITTFSFLRLLKMCYSTLIINIIYSMIMYFITYKSSGRIKVRVCK